MWKDIVKPDRSQMKILRLRIAWCITKATNTLSEYVILYAYPLQQWLHERYSMLRYTYIVCIVMLGISVLYNANSVERSDGIPKDVFSLHTLSHVAQNSWMVALTCINSSTRGNHLDACSAYYSFQYQLMWIRLRYVRGGKWCHNETKFTASQIVGRSQKEAAILWVVFLVL
jgi:hypothetical protein